jgi:hypothetical protein
MNVDDMNESRFLRAADCGEKGLLLVIEYVHKQNVAPLGEKPKEKWCSFHSNGVKPLVLNKTNRLKIAEILGTKETDDWSGGQIEAYRTHDIPFQGMLVDGIRVRAPGSGPNGANGGEKPAPVRPHPSVPLGQAKSDTPARGQTDIPF